MNKKERAFNNLLVSLITTLNYYEKKLLETTRGAGMLSRSAYFDGYNDGFLCYH